MTIELKILPIKTVVTVISVVWPIACAIMLWSLHSFTRPLILLFSGVAVVPILAVWVLLFAAQRLDARTTPEARRMKKAGGDGGGRPKKPNDGGRRMNPNGGGRLKNLNEGGRSKNVNAGGRPRNLNEGGSSMNPDQRRRPNGD